MIVQRGEFANYLRKNSGVKGDATSSEIQCACSAKLEQCERRSNASWRRHSRITSSTKHRRGPACHQTNVYCSFGPEKSRFGKELSGEHRLWQESDTRMDQPRRCFLSGRVLLGTAGQACHFQMPPSRRFIPNIFSSISTQRLRLAHSF